jgi:hypothetical protein
MVVNARGGVTEDNHSYVVRELTLAVFFLKRFAPQGRYAV